MGNPDRMGVIVENHSLDSASLSALDSKLDNEQYILVYSSPLFRFFFYFPMPFMVHSFLFTLSLFTSHLCYGPNKNMYLNDLYYGVTV